MVASNRRRGRRDPIEPLLDLLQADGIALERVDEGVELSPCLAKSHAEIAELGRDGSELGRERLERLERAKRLIGEHRRPGAVLGVERAGGGRRALDQLHMAPES